MRMTTSLLSLLLLAASVSFARPNLPSADELFARYKQVSGGEAWDSVAVLVSEGHGAVGGMSGAISVVEDVRSGRFKTLYELGPSQGGDGYDGERVWTVQGRGEVDVVSDAPQLRRTRTQIWMSRQGFWQPDLLDARVGSVEIRQGGSRYWVEVTPSEADPITLVFEANSGLLVQTRAQEGQDLVVADYLDFRLVDGLKIAHKMVINRGDRRNRLVLTWTQIQASTQPGLHSYTAPEAGPPDYRFANNAPVVIPFELINNHIYVDAVVDGQSHKMIFDTGGINLLSPAAVKRLGLESEGQMAVRGVGQKRQDLGMTRANTLSVGGFELDKPVLMVIDITQMQPVEGVAIEGLLGFEIFKRTVVRIDYPASTITLFPPAQAPPMSGTVIPFTLRGRTPVIEGVVDGMPARLTVDTGSRGAVSFHSPFAKQNKLVERYRPRFESVNGWGSGGSVRSRPVRVGELQLGDQVLRNLVGDIFLGDKGAFASPDTDANVGSGALKAFVVTFDYAGRKISLERSSNPFIADGYDRLGMWFNQAPQGPYLEVMAVTAGAPAERAGIRVGDQITAFNDAEAGSRSLSGWRIWARGLEVGSEVRVERLNGPMVQLRAADLLAER